MKLDRIKKIVMTSLDIDTIKTKNQKQIYVDARWIYFKLAKMFTIETHVDIGESIDRSHCLVHYGLNQFKSLIRNNKFRNRFAACVANLDNDDRLYVKFKYPKLYEIYLNKHYTDKLNKHTSKMNGYDLEYFYKTSVQNGRR